MYCPNCGRPAESGQQFCPGCGTPFASPADRAPGSADAKKKPHASSVTPIIVLIGIAAVLRFFRTDTPVSFGKKCSNETAAVAAYEDALNKCDAEKLLRLCYPEKVYETIGQSEIDSVQSDLEFIQAFAGVYAKTSSPQYDMKISRKISLDADSLHDIESYFSYTHGAEIHVTKGYAADVKMDVSGEKDTISLILYCAGDEGWKITPKTALWLLGRG